MSECCNICDTIGNPYAYWAFNARPAFEITTSLTSPTRAKDCFDYRHPDVPRFGMNTFGYVNNPVIKEYWNIRENNLEDAPESARWRLYLTKMRAKGMGGKNSSNNKDRLSSHKEWKVNCFPAVDGITPQSDFIFAVNFDLNNNTNWPSLEEQYILTNSPAVFGDSPLDDGLNSMLYNRRSAGYRTWACYHDDEQKYVVMEGTSAIACRSDIGETFVDASQWMDNDFYKIFSVIDIENQTVIRQNTVPYFGYDSVPYRWPPDAEETEDTPVGWGRCQEYVSRANWTANPWFTVFSSYDDWGIPTAEKWTVYRAPIDNSFATAGGDSDTVDSEQFTIVRGSYHSYTYGEDPNKYPWVIAVRKSDNTWVTGTWEQALTIPNPDEEVGGDIGIPALHNDDVQNTLTSGVLSSNAVLLCYNRVRNRDLVVWVDSGVLKDDWENVPGGRPSVEITEGVIVYAQFYMDQVVYVYDSERSPQLYQHEFQRIFIYPPDEGITPPDPCNPDESGKEDDGFPGGVLKPTYDDEYPPTRHKYFNIARRIRSNPTFITCDRDGMVYMGSPHFIMKSGRHANKWTGPIIRTGSKFSSSKDAWLLIFDAYAPKISLTAPTGCEIPGGYTRLVSLNQIYKTTFGSQGINVGEMNSREFAILPTKNGIHIRGCEGYPEMDTTGTFNNINYYNPYHLYVPEKSRSLWLTDWIFSPDAQQRVACVEEAYFYPRFIISSQQWAYSQYEGPSSPSDYSDWLESGVFPPLTYKFTDFFKYANANNGDAYELYSDKNREFKYYVTRRYYDELLHDYFSLYPMWAENRLDEGVMLWPYWETATNNSTMELRSPALEQLAMEMNVFLPHMYIQNNQREDIEAVMSGLRYNSYDYLSSSSPRRDKGWRLDYAFKTPISSEGWLWDMNTKNFTLHMLQNIEAYSSCWIRDVELNNNSYDPVAQPYRGILLDVVDI